MSNLVDNERYHGERYCPSGWSLHKWGDDLKCFKRLSARKIAENHPECDALQGHNATVPLPRTEAEEVSLRMLMIESKVSELRVPIDLRLVLN